MTDKQIIVDEINKTIEQEMENLRNIAKQQIGKLEAKLKRKEQEYEELRQYHNKYCEKFEKEKQELLGKYNQISRDFYNGKYCNKENCSLLKAKEQECNKLYIQLKADEEYHKEEENTLRKIIKNKEERNIELYKENNKLKQTLIEIKEIAQYDVYTSRTDLCLKLNWIKKKITECEVENAR